jgi:flagellar motor switch protein FliG
MTKVDPHLRKAAVLLRSLDADTAAVMLGRLSSEEAATIRAAMRAVGQVDTGDQAEVVAELRGGRPAKIPSGTGDVELTLSSSFTGERYGERGTLSSVDDDFAGSSNRFDFLENAPTHALVPHLAREHAQTIAVVLSHLRPERAAAVLAALPQKVQAETVERLSTLGETDPESLSALKRELENWAAKRDGLQASNGRRRDTMAAILAAADATSRGQILSNMKDHKAVLAKQFAPRNVARPAAKAADAKPQVEVSSSRIVDKSVRQPAATPAQRVDVEEARLPRINFDDLAKLDSRTLSAVLRQIDANVLALALAGSREELVDRICEQMPKRTAREFRRQLRRLAPTRLSDVEGAQRAVAQIAARQLAEHQPTIAKSRR